MINFERVILKINLGAHMLLPAVWSSYRSLTGLYHESFSHYERCKLIALPQGHDFVLATQTLHQRNVSSNTSVRAYLVKKCCRRRRKYAK